jgi:hypothetical protein
MISSALHPLAKSGCGTLEVVPDYCTCGVQLPRDARFCHKCGKPQYDYPGVEAEPEPDAEPAVVAPVQVDPPKAVPAEISFRNSTAVRAGFMAAALVFLIMSLPLPAIVAFLWMGGCLFFGGILGVFFYVRRTGKSITVRSGARMGWITGIFCFAIGFVVSSATLLYFSQSGGIAAHWREQLRLRGTPDTNIEEALRLLESTPGLAVMIVFFVVFMFTIFTLLPTAGGALGAKLLKRDSQS